jgi:uncharacterized membrane protein HdeD (DUF308 family)
MDDAPATTTWWAVGLRGLAAIVFGLLALLLPALTLEALVLLFGVYALVEGFLSVIGAIRSGTSLLGSLVSIGAGVVTLALPSLTALVLLCVIAVWAVVHGIFEIAGALRLRRRREGTVMLGANGALSIVFGVLTLVLPGAGAISLAWLLGAYAIVLGGLLLRTSLELRRRSAGRWPPGRSGLRSVTDTDR